MNDLVFTIRHTASKTFWRMLLKIVPSYKNSDKAEFKFQPMSIIPPIPPQTQINFIYIQFSRHFSLKLKTFSNLLKGSKTLSKKLIHYPKRFHFWSFLFHLPRSIINLRTPRFPSHVSTWHLLSASALFVFKSQ